jgi:hypothetical protein
VLRTLESRVALLEERHPPPRATLPPEVARQRLDCLLRLVVAVATGQDDAQHRQALADLPPPVDIDMRAIRPEPRELLTVVRRELESRARGNDTEAVELLARLESAGHA